MPPEDIDILRLKEDAALKREEIQADVKKVVYGTFLLGVAVALFPVISGFIEHYFNLRIESARQVNALALQANQLDLDLQKLTREGELAIASAKAATEQSDRSFFETISDEARSARLSDRITIAEFFAFVARDDDERERWKAFLGHLIEVQGDNNSRRAALLLTMGDAAKSASEREAAARELDQIDQRESGVGPTPAPSKWLEMVPIPDPASTGAAGLTFLRQSDLSARLGRPSATPGNQCQTPDNPGLVALTETRNIGPFTATLLAPALASLERVMADVKAAAPDLYAETGSLGGLCVRLLRGSSSGFSNHSWGTAIDISIGGTISPFGRPATLAGLAELAKYFAKEGWTWGAYFPRPDPGHFEISAETFAEWEAAGLLKPKDAPAP